MASDHRIRSWSDLPKELVEMIANCFNTETDVRRFRAVCNSWRSYTKPLKKFPCERIKLPYPFKSISFNFCSELNGRFFTLVERTVYRVELPTDSKFSWLVKLQRMSNGKMRLINPSSHDQIEILPGIQMPKTLNTLNFRVYEVCKAYALKYVNCSNNEYRHAGKVIYSQGIKNDDYFVMALDIEGALWCINSGDNKWTLMPNNNFTKNVFYEDLVNLEGQIYGIDTCGRIWEFDSLFNSKEFANGIDIRPLKRSSVSGLEYSSGEFNMVEKVRSKNPCFTCLDRGIFSRLVWVATLEIKVWTLNIQERKWVDAKLLNGRIIFAGEDCSFSISSKEFGGCNATRVFYTNEGICFQTHEETKPPSFEDLERGYCSNCRSTMRSYQCFDTNKDVKLRFRGLHGHTTGVYDFETGKVGSLLLYYEFADIFWPPPSWLFL